MQCYYFIIRVRFLSSLFLVSGNVLKFDSYSTFKLCLIDGGFIILCICSVYKTHMSLYYIVQTVRAVYCRQAEPTPLPPKNKLQTAVLEVDI
jgi:hypothetical protein